MWELIKTYDFWIVIGGMAAFGVAVLIWDWFKYQRYNRED